MNTISESIFDNGKVIIPMAEVSHIERDQREAFKGGISVIFKHSKWDDMAGWIPVQYMMPDEAKEFTKSWCFYRSEVEALAGL